MMDRGGETNDEREKYRCTINIYDSIFYMESNVLSVSQKLIKKWANINQHEYFENHLEIIPISCVRIEFEEFGRDRTKSGEIVTLSFGKLFS